MGGPAREDNSLKTMAAQGQGGGGRGRGGNQTCASSYLAISVVVALQRMLEPSHLFVCPSNTRECLDGALGSQGAQPSPSSWR